MLALPLVGDHCNHSRSIGRHYLLLELSERYPSFLASEEFVCTAVSMTTRPEARAAIKISVRGAALVIITQFALPYAHLGILSFPSSKRLNMCRFTIGFCCDGMRA